MDDRSERLVTNFFCPVCGRITWSGDKHKCTPPPYKPEGGTWIEGDVIAAAYDLYAALESVEWELDHHEEYVCPWCGGYENGEGHKPDCRRQLALKKARGMRQMQEKNNVLESVTYMSNEPMSKEEWQKIVDKMNRTEQS